MTESTGGSFRPKRVNFAQISNAALQDANLSLKAKGLYALIQSLITLPGEDGLRLWKIRKKCKEGDKAFDSAWKELKDAGYLKQYRIPNGKNGAFRYEYELLDVPDLTTPATVNRNKDGEAIRPETKDESHPTDHAPQNGGGGQSAPYDEADPDPDHIPQNGGNGKIPESIADHTPHFGAGGKSTPCFPDPMEKGGDISNTLSSNTGFNNTHSDNTSIRQSDRPTDFLRARLKKQIEYDYFEENYPESIAGIDALVDSMVDMLTRKSTKINGVDQSCEALNQYISRVDSCTVREFLEHMKNQDLTGVKNLFAYYQTSLINYLREQEIILLKA